jgi:hypothetical protein
MRLEKYFAEFRSEMARCKGYLSTDLMQLFKNLSKEVKRDNGQQQVMEELGPYLESLNSDWPILFGPSVSYYQATGGQNDDNLFSDLHGRPERWARHLRSRMRMPVLFDCHPVLSNEAKIAEENEALPKCYNAAIVAHSYEELARKLALLPEGLLALKLSWSNEMAPELRRQSTSPRDFDRRQEPRVLDLSRFKRLRYLKFVPGFVGPTSVFYAGHQQYDDRALVTRECLFNRLVLPNSIEILNMGAEHGTGCLSRIKPQDSVAVIDGHDMSTGFIRDSHRRWLSSFDDVVLENLVIYEGDPFLCRMPNVEQILSLNYSQMMLSASLQLHKVEEIASKNPSVTFSLWNSESQFMVLNPTSPMTHFENRGDASSYQRWWRDNSKKWCILPEDK